MAYSEGTTLAEAVLYNTELFYAVCLLLVYAVSSAAFSVVSLHNEEDAVDPVARGPGGRRLPATKRKKRLSTRHTTIELGVVVRWVFYWIMFLIVLTFLADAVNVSTHAVHELTGNLAKDQLGWWCGSEMSVSVFSLTLRPF
jgi:ATP-binding cassette, subfamily B, vacuolar membrane transporter HMT1/ACLQ